MRAISFIRHGQSEFNRHWAATGTDPLIRDAPLSELGHAQVAAARAAAQALEPDVVITSPLTRAVQTAVGLFGDDGAVPIVVDAMHRERVTNTDDIGSQCKRLYHAMPDPQIRADLIHCVMDVGSGHNRWYVMGIFDELMEEQHDQAESLAIAEMFSRVSQHLRIWAKDRLSEAKLHPAIVTALNQQPVDEDED